MKYFKIIGPTPEEDAFVSSPFEDDTPEKLCEDLGSEIGLAAVVEITRAEFEAATADLYFEDENEDEDIFLEDTDPESCEVDA
jgi:hypothetical protein